MLRSSCAFSWLRQYWMAFVCIIIAARNARCSKARSAAACQAHRTGRLHVGHMSAGGT